MPFWKKDRDQQNSQWYHQAIEALYDTARALHLAAKLEQNGFTGGFEITARAYAQNGEMELAIRSVPK
jgi:hypothetical protein